MRLFDEDEIKQLFANIQAAYEYIDEAIGFHEDSLKNLKKAKNFMEDCGEFNDLAVANSSDNEE